MVDKICWWADYDALIAEALIVCPELVTENEDGTYTIKTNTTPIVISKDGESMALVRDTDGTLFPELEKLTTMEILGTYAEVFADTDKKIIYSRIYPHEPYDIDDGEGGTITITPPEMFGVFAGGLVIE